MRKASVFITFCVAALCSSAQSSLINEIDHANIPSVALAPLRFLASDELMGRATLRPEIQIAARYISEQFRSFGLQEVASTRDYFQNFELKSITSPISGSLTIGNKVYQLGSNLLQVRGTSVSLTAPVIYGGFGSGADLVNLNVQGKIVVINIGENDSTPPRNAGRYRAAKQKLLQEKGAVAMIEHNRLPTSEWETIKRITLRGRVVQPQDSMLPVFLLHDLESALPSLLKNDATTATIFSIGSQIKNVQAKNVMGWVQGTDASLKEQFIILSAHYDHIGVANQPKMEEGKLDSIYNGARDNAIGITAVINAARYFAQYPPKRSILFIAYTGEEMGLLGSQYFAENPTIALKKVVYNLNIDNTSYNDTSRVTVIGLGRTSADNDIKRACSVYRLTAMPDPAPEQNLFDRSDNVSLAVKGVPAPTFSLGIKKFDENISNRYHQLSDEVGNMDVSYAMRYMKSFILAAKYIADNPAQPKWNAGDKYEAAWKALYLKSFQ